MHVTDQVITGKSAALAENGKQRPQRECLCKSRWFFFLFSWDFCTQLLIEKLYLEKAAKRIQLKVSTIGALSDDSSFRGII